MNPPSVTYINSQLRIRCEFSKEYTLSQTSIPDSLLLKATRKLAYEMALGRIESYVIHRKRLETIWSTFRESKLGLNETIAVTIGTGYPYLPGVRFTPSFKSRTYWELYRSNLAQKTSQPGIQSYSNYLFFRKSAKHTQTSSSMWV